ncbi:MAG TPA: 50S ribosomal protein L18 [Candidatus Paceibacterota bacterium]|nr:50S ribosomal protein L18 [Candidatus Paceibacterota bacterium]
MVQNLKDKNRRKNRRMARVRARISGTSEKPRLAVFRSHQNIYGQLIDDESRKTLVAVSSLKATDKKKTKKVDLAAILGEELAKKALAKGIKKVVFDRRSYKFHGRVASFASGARKGGLNF